MLELEAPRKETVLKGWIILNMKLKFPYSDTIELIHENAQIRTNNRVKN